MEVLRPVDRKVLLNPGPSTTTDTVKYAQVVPDICPREREFVEVMEEVRRDLVRVVHGDPQKYAAVMFAGSGTIVQDVLVNSLVPEGKKLCVVNNGSYSQRMVDIAHSYGIPCVNLEFPVDQLPNPDVLAETLERDSDIAVVATVHHETGSGVLNPIREIGRIAHDNGCIFIADTISTYALMPIDIEEENVDFLMSSAQKGLTATTGVSWTVGRRDEIQRSRNYPVRSYYCNLHMQYEHFEQSGEMHFTPPVQTIYALRQAIREYWDEGEAARWKRLTACWEAVHRGLEELGLAYVIPKDLQSRLVVAVRAPRDRRFEFGRLHDYCLERGFTIYPGKMFGEATFRLCNLGHITDRDIRDFFEVARAAFLEMGFRLPIDERQD